MRRIPPIVLLALLSGCHGRTAPPAPPAAALASAASVTASPLCDGVEVESIAPAGLSRRALDVDPFRAEARLVFQAASSPVTVHLVVRVHDGLEAARGAVSDARALAARPLAGAPGLPPGCIAAVDERGRVTFAALASKNVSCTARLVVGDVGDVDGAVDDAPLRAAVAAFVEAVSRSPSGPPAPPRVAIPAQACVVGATVLRVEVDAAGPPAAFFAYEAEGASLIPSDLGPTLYASGPGTVTLRVAAATSRLGSCVIEAPVVVVAPGSRR